MTTTKPTNKRTTSPAPDYVPGGTRVLNTSDGESGYVMNGFTYDPAAGWTEYEVETAYGVERWQRSDFILFSEFEPANG